MQTIELQSIEALTPYRRNARTHSKKQIRQIADSIRRFGFVNPVLVDDRGVIIAGHGRVEAARLLGLAQVPTLRLSHLGEAEKRALIPADNRLAQEAGWDEGLLAIELKSLVELDFEVELTGFETAEIDLLTKELRETRNDVVPSGSAGRRDACGPTSGTAAVPAALAERDAHTETSRDRLTVSRPGDLWILGEHRLSCGSASTAEDYLSIDAAIRRWQGCTGRSARLAATGEAFAEIERRLSKNPAPPATAFAHPCRLREGDSGALTSPLVGEVDASAKPKRPVRGATPTVGAAPLTRSLADAQDRPLPRGERCAQRRRANLVAPPAGEPR